MGENQHIGRKRTMKENKICQFLLINLITKTEFLVSILKNLLNKIHVFFIRIDPLMLSTDY